VRNKPVGLCIGLAFDLVQLCLIAGLSTAGAIDVHDVPFGRCGHLLGRPAVTWRRVTLLARGQYSEGSRTVVTLRSASVMIEMSCPAPSG
jgi:hypothetical protein